MFEVLMTTFLACSIAGGVFAVLSFAMFDRLLKQVWTRSESAWTDLGKPVGFFWVPPGTKNAGLTKAAFARNDLFSQWSAANGESLLEDKQGAARLRRYRRISSWCFALGAVQLVTAVTLLFSGHG
ncbi:hypothetical protein [Prosthecobacter sp.]|uniref:hypothetical protein n=1 Tax=Prosthecobacter sp. TaxID=1965333 RepID=UPI003782F2A1